MHIVQYPGITVPHIANPAFTEILWVVLFAGLLAIIAVQMRKRATLSFTALMAIAGFSICWQETYSNWGPYLLYSPDFHLIPWGSTWWTSPNKPWFLLLSYPVFMTFIFTVMIALIRLAKTLLPKVSLLALTIIIAPPLFYLNNLALDASSVKNGAWIYADAMGPILPMGKVFEPLLWPPAAFVLFGAVMCYLLMIQSEPGHPTFERLFHPEKVAPGFRREAVRALAWVVVWNVLYWVLLIVPVDLVRQIWGPTSTLVP